MARKLRPYHTVALSIILLVTYNTLPDFQKRVDAGINDIQQLIENNKGTGSLNQRIVWSIQGFQIFLQNPIIGVGIGDFESAQIKVNETSSFKTIPTSNPHNQYAFTLATVGMVGFLFMVAIFYQMLRLTYQNRDEFTYLRIGLLIMYPLIFLAESYLLRGNTALLFFFFTAVLFQSDLMKRSTEK